VIVKLESNLSPFVVIEGTDGSSFTSFVSTWFIVHANGSVIVVRIVGIKHPTYIMS
jgi:hypothetical protein